MYVSVYITAANADEAERIATTLVHERLAACVNFFPCRSIYRWQGSIEQAGEFCLLCKTKKALFEKLQSRVKAIHSYDVPAIVAFDILEGEPEYLRWIDEVTSGE
jgi:periplasmic divalent cation tolerance protein